MKNKLKINKVFFPRSIEVGKRKWGKEILLVLIPKILSLKKLKIKKGKKGGLQFHRKKNECGYILSGKLLVRFDNGKGKLIKKILKTGQAFHFPPGSVHQEQALTDCTIIEASTPHFNDRVRVEKKYGIVDKDGMPSTKKSEIIYK